MTERKTIYLDDAINALEHKKDKKAKGDIGGFYNKIIQNDIDALMQLPSAQPKKGKWKEHKDYPGLAYLCSECGYFTTMRTNFCPNCGADMREGGEDE